MKESGLETELRNNVFHWIQEKKKEIFNSTSEHNYLKKAQLQWDKRIHKSLQSMCNEIGIGLAKLRSPADRDELIEKWGELSTYDVGNLSKILNILSK